MPGTGPGISSLGRLCQSSLIMLSLLVSRMRRYTIREMPIMMVTYQ